MDRDLPFVWRRAGDRSVTDPVAAEAARSWVLPPPTWLATGMNAVYLAGDTVARVGRVNGRPEAGAELAAVLRSTGVRVASPLPLPPYRGDDGLVATAWEHLPDSGRPIDWLAVGEMVARLHTLEEADVPVGYPLPWCGAFPWWQVDSVLSDVAGELDAVAANGLARTVERLGGWERLVDHHVVCHGDVHWNNVIMLDDGPALIDWDLLCRAPPAWDHAPLLRYAERWGGGSYAYDDFAAGYGVSMRGDRLAEALAELRLVAATLMRVIAARDDNVAGTESAVRQRYWRGETDAPAWTSW